LADPLPDHHRAGHHHLEVVARSRPVQAAESNVKPVTVEAVAMDWKWLFIYPELKIATVNQLALPVNTPVNFKITSDSIMNSFFIPQLGSRSTPWPAWRPSCTSSPMKPARTACPPTTAAAASRA
jgi:heme/copper-type cytochrome/quinol oxidase subunit 2